MKCKESNTYLCGFIVQVDITYDQSMMQIYSPYFNLRKHLKIKKTIAD